MRADQYAKLSPQEREAHREQRREYMRNRYANLSPEKREAQREYMREYMRKIFADARRERERRMAEELSPVPELNFFNEPSVQTDGPSTES